MKLYYDVCFVEMPVKSNFKLNLSYVHFHIGNRALYTYILYKEVNSIQYYKILMKFKTPYDVTIKCGRDFC